jgi:hypothetical protein
VIPSTTSNVPANAGEAALVVSVLVMFAWFSVIAPDAADISISVPPIKSIVTGSAPSKVYKSVPSVSPPSKVKVNSSSTLPPVVQIGRSFAPTRRT